MIVQFINAILLGGYYTIVAIGLAFMFSVMRLINLAHGALIVLSAYGIWVLATTARVPFPLAILLMAGIMFLFGIAVHRAILSRAAAGGEFLPLLATFGLAIILDNLMFQAFGANTFSLAPLIGDLSWASFELPGSIFVGELSVYVIITAVAVIALLELLLRKTPLGRRIQATSQDRATSSLLGIDTGWTAAIATGIAFMTAALAGAALGLRTAWGPYSGSAQLLFAFEAAVIGGMGSLWRVMAGAVVLAVAQSAAATIHPQGFQIGGHIAFLIALFIRLAANGFSLRGMFSTGRRT